MKWEEPGAGLGRVVTEQTIACLAVYREDPSRVEQDTRIELEAAEGGYGRKQLFELVQNAADAMQTSPGPIHVVLTDKHFYIANAGIPFSPQGVRSLLASHLSRKGDDEIGQFGLGFKSVTALGDHVSIFSRTGSFEFDGGWAASKIKAIGINEPRYPLLRLANPISPSAHAASDRELARLMGWASTIIRVPLKRRGSHKNLAEDIARFPAPFLLFSQGVTELQLDDRSSGVRTFRLERKGEHLYLLTENSETTEWVVVSAKHTPSLEALRDAGELNRREAVPITWAAPRQGQKQTVGEFWAFFPTNIKTTLSGIVNAPWKLSADRLSMIEGKFNQELLTEVLPELVAQGIRLLYREDDPAAMIDVLPARGKEGRSWADDTINQPVIDAAAHSASLPDLTGNPTFPRNLAVHPQDMPRSWLDAWSTEHPSAWVHHSIDRTKERRLKAHRLITAGRGKDVGLTAWVASMAVNKTPEGSARALNLARLIVETVPSLRSEILRGDIVLLEDGRLVRPERGRVFIRSDGETADHDYIHPDLAALPGVMEALATFGIEVLNPVGELRAALQRRPSGQDWSHIWPLIRKVGNTDQVLHVLREELGSPLTHSVFARVRSGKWRALTQCLLPGEILPAHRSEDNEFLVDDRHHGADLPTLERCGAVASPRLVPGAPDEPWLVSFKQVMVEQYKGEVKNPRLSDESVAVEGSDPLWPLDLLSRLSEEARASMTRKVLQLSSPEPWTLFHRTNSGYPKHECPNPTAWWLSKHGQLPTTLGPLPVEMCLHPDASVHREIFPVAEIPIAWAQALGLRTDVDHWQRAHWDRFIKLTELRNVPYVASAYANAADSGLKAPSTIRAARNSTSLASFPPGQVAVTDSPETHASLITAGIPSLLVAETWEYEVLRDEWGLADGRQMLKEETVAVPAGEAFYLTDRFPPLKLYAREVQDLDSLMIQPCSAIDLLISTPKGQEIRRTLHNRDGMTINVEAGTDAELLARIGQALNLSLDIARVLDQIERSKRNARRADILKETSTARKLVLAVGAENLRGRLPKSALDELRIAKNADLTAEELADLALAVHGYDILRELRSELQECGLEPPKQWAGSRDARKFVTSLGFDVEYAGFPGNRLDPVLSVDGPADLPPLHDYQREVVAGIQRLLRSKEKIRRGMVTLPTGAGKTRVAAQSVVDLVASGDMFGPVLWIGQTEELCEQAVQSWSYIWRARGSGAMTVSRFWSSNDVDQAPPGSFQIVVATIDKLDVAREDPRYEWLKGVSLIIVDEAHSSIAPSYTKVFQWLSGEALTTRMRTPLLGLTATAYRGHSAEETKRLVTRYGSNKIDDGVFGEEEPYAYLQRRGVLAKVRQEVLTGMDITLTTDAGKHLSRFGTLPSHAEQEVGKNAERNAAILESVLQQPDHWTMLLFASSVEHARAMAAQLSYHGVAARPIDGGTDPALRRRYVEQFRGGEIRVLTNYNVLTQGFDAPMVEAVYVTRPTFSPNLYQQMIGRGLRGVKNGGSKEVLIVNVRDNIQNYGEHLAFHHFDYLWTVGNGD